MSSVISLPLLDARDDAASLVEGVRAGDASARAALYDRHAAEVACVLAAVLGPDAELADLLQETFVEAFVHIGALRRDEAIGAWLRRIAVFRARRTIRRRRRTRLFQALGLAAVPDVPAEAPAPEVREALAATYAIIDELPLELRLAFTLRYVEGLELVDVAAACSVSLATVKRRLTEAEARFRRMAARTGKLDDWLRIGERS